MAENNTIRPSPKSAALNGDKHFLHFSAGLQMNTVSVYDIQNKFIAYSAPLPDVMDVICEWGSIYILAGDRKVHTYMDIIMYINI